MFKKILFTSTMLLTLSTAPVKADNQDFVVVEAFGSLLCSYCAEGWQNLYEVVQNYSGARVEVVTIVYENGFSVSDLSDWRSELSAAGYPSLRYNGANPVPLLQSDGTIDKSASEYDAATISHCIDTMKEAPQFGLLLDTAGTIGDSTVYSYSISGLSDPSAWDLVAVVRQDSCPLYIGAGENMGKTLRNLGMAKSHRKIALTDSVGTITMGLPAGVSADSCNVFAYLRKHDSTTTAACSNVLRYPSSSPVVPIIRQSGAESINWVSLRLSQGKIRVEGLGSVDKTSPVSFVNASGRIQLRTTLGVLASGISTSSIGTGWFGVISGSIDVRSIILP